MMKWSRTKRTRFTHNKGTLILLQYTIKYFYVKTCSFVKCLHFRLFKNESTSVHVHRHLKAKLYLGLQNSKTSQLTVMIHTDLLLAL